MDTYTAFVVDTDFGATTTWISLVKASNLKDARNTAETQCAEDWDYKPNEVTCIGLAQGDINLVYWNDEANSTHETD